MLTSDVSAANTTNDAKVDECVKLTLELGDPDITIDLREHRSGRSSKYDTFWKIAAQFLAGKAADVVTAVDERRHDTVVHLATAISVNDLLNQIKRECPPETPIPSAQWLRLQFWPKNPTRLSRLQFTGLLPLKFMVQTRQLRAFHPDVHYASALFRYEKEFVIKFQKITNFVFLDDKHRCKVGKPGFPVAAVERGKKVVVSKDTTFAVADHDFTKTGIIPSVAMICDIPESINGDFYMYWDKRSNLLTFLSSPPCDRTFLKKNLLKNQFCVYIRIADQITIACILVYSYPALIYLSFHCTGP